MINEVNIEIQSSGSRGMQLFAALVTELSSSTKTNDKLQSLVDYFATAPDADKVWVIALFSGRRPRRTVNLRLMREWCLEMIDIPDWLFTECHSTVGDFSETLALLLSDVEVVNPQDENLCFYLEKFIHLEKENESVKKKFIVESWQQMNSKEKFVFNKLITGSFRVGVSQKNDCERTGKSCECFPIGHCSQDQWQLGSGHHQLQ